MRQDDSPFPLAGESLPSGFVPGISARGDEGEGRPIAILRDELPLTRLAPVAGRSRKRERFTFLRQFTRDPRSVGAVLPSSARLAETMLAPVDFARARTLVEFGPGTGAFTRAIAHRLQPEARYLGIERNPVFHRTLSLAFPRFAFALGSVTDLEHMLAQHGVTSVDAIISGLPWASLPIAMQESVFAAVDRALTPGGVFVTFAYVHGLGLPGARALRHSLRHRFGRVSRSPVVWRNVPPAFAYICRKPEI